MRRLAPLLGVLALSVGALFWAWDAWHAPDPAEVEAEAVSWRAQPFPVRPEPVVLPPPPTSVEELADVAARARALLRAGRADEAVALLERWRERLPEAFEAAATWGLLERARLAAAPVEESQEESVARRFRASRDVAAMASSPAARAHLERHVDLFVPRLGGGGDGDEAKDWLGGLYEAQVTGPRTWAEEAPLLAVADAEAAEARRMAQLRRLATRGATELLAPVHGALLWLALHQGEDGRLTDRSVKARCEALGHGKGEDEKTCTEVYGVAVASYDTAATALALLAFLDFRDQDAREIFEPTIAQATRWLAAQQEKDGTFKGSREYYVTAISLMALAQAAASADNDALRATVAKGLEGLYAKRCPYGGYRYWPEQVGDLSVTGWVAQAVEAARAAEVAIPERMEDELRNFLGRVWMDGSRFTYVPTSREERSTLFPVGMLSGHILWEEPDERVLDEWRAWLGRGSVPRPELYTLYYGLRMSLLLEGGLVEPWRGWAGALRADQVREGTAAGMFTRGRDIEWITFGGCVIQTAFTTLTLEHALYER